MIIAHAMTHVQNLIINNRAQSDGRRVYNDGTYFRSRVSQRFICVYANAIYDRRVTQIKINAEENS